MEALGAEIERFGATAYVLCGGADGRPHISHATVTLDGGALHFAAGRRSAANMTERPLVAVLWPPFEPGGFSLIVDAVAEVHENGVRLVPTNAVLHRPAPVPSPAAEGDPIVPASECRPVSPTAE